jgi:HEAT repeat protein
MRAVEVSFIRDCAEMAARSSLTRTESRWGLYHDRSDVPDRDDVNWRYHLNLRKSTEGAMEFFKRPVAEYFVPVPGLDDLPTGGTEPIPVAQPTIAYERHSAVAPVTVVNQPPAQPPSPRIAAVLALESPSLDDLAEFLADSDPAVRRTAVDALTENLCDGYADALYAALSDSDSGVRRAAAEGVRELVEVLPDPVAGQPLLSSADPLVRSAALYLLSFRRVGDADSFRAALADPDHRVRIEAVRALVSVDDADGVASAANDENREVRIVVANGLGTLASGPAAVRGLTGDRDPLVRAAAFAALGEIGGDDSDLVLIKRALGDSAWQIRVGAVRALSGADETAVTFLSRALVDPHLDVRKAAVLGLTRWVAQPAAQDALLGALDDTDADVRAYARQALARRAEFAELAD